MLSWTCQNLVFIKLFYYYFIQQLGAVGAADVQRDAEAVGGDGGFKLAEAFAVCAEPPDGGVLRILLFNGDFRAAVLDDVRHMAPRLEDLAADVRVLHIRVLQIRQMRDEKTFAGGDGLVVNG